MRVAKVISQYKLKEYDFIDYLDRIKPKGLKSGLIDDYFEDSADIEEIVDAYKHYKAEVESKAAEEKEKAAEEKERSEKAAAEKRAALANMLITSGFNFDGYRITKYSGYISGDDAISVERKFSIFANSAVKDQLLNSLAVIRRNALIELKEAAYALGCNAVIGVDFDYLTLDPQRAGLAAGVTIYDPYVFGVTANGNAVIIEKTLE